MPEEGAEGADQPWLLVAKARIFQQDARYSEAAALYETAAKLLAKSGDKEGLLAVLLSSAFCLFIRGVWEESLGILKRCAAVATTAEEKAEVLVAEGTVLVSLCRWDEGVEALGGGGGGRGLFPPRAPEPLSLTGSSWAELACSTRSVTTAWPAPGWRGL